MDLDNIIIPPISAVSFQVIKFDPESEAADSQALERIVTPDEGVCSEILRVSNSSFYGRSGRVKSLKDAITLIGLKATRNLIILLSTKAMNAGLKGETFTRHLNEFSVTCALVASELCDRLNLKQYKEEAFISALLHKIGMTVFALNKRREYADLLRKVETEFADLAEEERKRYRIDHVELGQKLMQRWHLPDQYLDVIAHHNFKPEETGQVSDLVRITALASITGREMMGILLPMNELNRRASLVDYYGAQDWISSYDEKYFAKLREHSFYKVAVG
ncbi:MAG: HDOD domain-containing protein [Leptospiraceae bacterium]|nr:HDOD domain-containing protein [Leptospiraceae bacterium]